MPFTSANLERPGSPVVCQCEPMRPLALGCFPGSGTRQEATDSVRSLMRELPGQLLGLFACSAEGDGADAEEPKPTSSSPVASEGRAERREARDSAHRRNVSLELPDLETINLQFESVVGGARRGARPTRDGSASPRELCPTPRDTGVVDGSSAAEPAELQPTPRGASPRANGTCLAHAAEASDAVDLGTPPRAPTKAARAWLSPREPVVGSPVEAMLEYPEPPPGHAPLITVQWFRQEASPGPSSTPSYALDPIVGATANTYVPTAEDDGRTLVAQFLLCPPHDSPSPATAAALPLLLHATSPVPVRPDPRTEARLSTLLAGRRATLKLACEDDVGREHTLVAKVGTLSISRAGRTVFGRRTARIVADPLDEARLLVELGAWLPPQTPRVDSGSGRNTPGALESGELPPRLAYRCARNAAPRERDLAVMLLNRALRGAFPSAPPSPAPALA